MPKSVLCDDVTGSLRFSDLIPSTNRRGANGGWRVAVSFGVVTTLLAGCSSHHSASPPAVVSITSATTSPIASAGAPLISTAATPAGPLDAAGKTYGHGANPTGADYQPDVVVVGGGASSRSRRAQSRVGDAAHQCRDRQGQRNPRRGRLPGRDARAGRHHRRHQERLSRCSRPCLGSASFVGGRENEVAACRPSVGAIPQADTTLRVEVLGKAGFLA
jgi:hypothetical protein